MLNKMRVFKQSMLKYYPESIRKQTLGYEEYM